MRLVRQRTTTDCGVAAVAMIADISYDEAKAAFGRFSGRTFLTQAKDLRHALKRLGLRMSKRRKRLRGAIQIQLDFDAIAYVRLFPPDGDDEDHWVVWDAVEQKILDPLRSRAKETYQFRAYYKIKRRPKRGKSRLG